MTTAAVTLPCPDLDAAVEFFGELGFRVESVRPADDPAVIVVAGHGLRLRLDRAATGDPGALHLELDGGEARELRAPNGTVVKIEPADPPVELPALEPALIVARHRGATWTEGRAGMRYRDLIPGRYGGRFIASHIHIAGDGPVPDYVHYHRVRFQLIACVAGWVRVVYQDQGPPFVLEPGDAVLQAPGIRHRVLESGGGLEVVEITSPADHETRADHELELPNHERVDRSYGGQRFVHHVAARGMDLGITEATGGLATAAITAGDGAVERHHGEIRFGFVLAGSARLEIDDDTTELGPKDAFAVPPGRDHRVVSAAPDFALLDVRI